LKFTFGEELKPDRKRSHAAADLEDMGNLELANTSPGTSQICCFFTDLLFISSHSILRSRNG